VKETSKENQEITCCEYFLDWYNKQHKRNYIHQRADTHFPDLKDKLNWDFIVYERDNPQEWIGIEVKELAIVRGTSIQFEFWRDLCLELTQDLERRGVQGEFEISFPPVFVLAPRKRQTFQGAFTKVLIDKQRGWKVGETRDIGPDIASRFPRWPIQKSDVDEYDKWGEYRLCELQITKSSDSGCRVSSFTSPLIGGDMVEAHKEAFNEVFKLKNDAIQADRQLKLAKEKKARKTILLLACNPVVEEGLIKDQVQNLSRHLIPDIDCIYLVDIGNEDRVVKIYPG